ncbi:MAG: DUF2815 family protein [SAR324 cluster bacterium]|nr:DUF2815 family protein [SAR324 cluster bacterium]
MTKSFHTPAGRLSYPHLDAPQTGFDGAKPKYSASLIFEKGTDISVLEKLVLAAAEEKWPKKAKAMLSSGKLRNPIRDDWEDKPGYPEGCAFISAKSDRQPGMVLNVRGPDGRPKGVDPEDIRETFYPGANVRFSVSVYTYDVNGNRGVSFALNNIQKLSDNDRLDGRVSAEDDFEATEEEELLDMAA